MSSIPIAFDGACDCHFHVYEDGYTLAPTATFKPPHAPAEAYRRVQQELGLTRAVVIQPTGYGFDNRCTMEAVAVLGAGTRAIVVVPPDEPDTSLAALDRAGARGVRYMMLPGGVLPWAGLEAMAARIAPLGWHIDLQLDGRELPGHEATLLALPCRLAIDHVGRFLGPTDTASPGFLSLARLLDAGRCWVKLSAPYESSLSGPPAYADIAPLARRLAEGWPERCLWASNWPHPNRNPAPTEQAMLEWALQFTHDETARHRMLVDNPAELYGF
jgi:D-galactarolactone isomerase